MNAESVYLNLSLSGVKRDCLNIYIKCYERGLIHSAKWASELSYSLDEVNTSDVFTQTDPPSQESLEDHDSYAMAKCYFDLKEYERAAYFLDKCTTPKAYFLYMYSRYMCGEKKRQDDAVDAIGDSELTSKEFLKVLRVELDRKHKSHELDGFGLYLYALVLKKLDLLQEAIDVFVESVNKEPLLWSSWLELSMLITDKDMLSTIGVPTHWMKHFFMAAAYLELQLNEEALRIYHSLSKSGFGNSAYVRAQTALAYHNLRDVELAVEEFTKLKQIDPYRLENMDVYSNLLYVKEMRMELANLAHTCCDIDKYRVETCCVIGNYYSVRGQHEKAVLYFSRALKLNPNYLAAWTLMGHEYMELKNTTAAVQAYRHAIEANRRDYRAWYGLGQTYELLKMPLYCLYYYRKAQVLRPNDSRMIAALGDAYEKLNRLQEAKKCYWKAHSLGDIEGVALFRLAKLYEKLIEEENAAAAYAEYVCQAERQGPFAFADLSMAFKYLANYHLKHGNLDDAYAAAQKCTEFNETKEEGKALLRQISQLRALGTDNTGLQDPTVLASQLPVDQHTTPQPRLKPISFHQHSGSVAVDVTGINGEPMGYKVVKRSILETIIKEAMLVAGEPQTRRLCGFGVINLIATVVLLIWCNSTNSMALTAFTFLTIFDIFSLLTCLVSIWVKLKQPSYTFSFGYERFEVLAVFSSTLLAQLGALFILKESVERMVQQPDIHQGRLLLGTALGFSVHMLISYFNNNRSFVQVVQASSSSWLQEHVTDLSESLCNVLPGMSKLLLPRINPFALIGSASAGALITTYFLIDIWNYHAVDTWAAVWIALMTSGTMFPMSVYTGKILLQTTPSHMISQLDKCLREASTLDGVLEFRNEHFWTLAFGSMAGSVHVRVRRDADEQIVLAHVYHRLSNIVKILTVQIFKDDWNRPSTFQIIGDTSLFNKGMAPGPQGIASISAGGVPNFVGASPTIGASGGQNLQSNSYYRPPIGGASNPSLGNASVAPMVRNITNPPPPQVNISNLNPDILNLLGSTKASAANVYKLNNSTDTIETLKSSPGSNKTQQQTVYQHSQFNNISGVTPALGFTPPSSPALYNNGGTNSYTAYSSQSLPRTPPDGASKTQ